MLACTNPGVSHSSGNWCACLQVGLGTLLENHLANGISQLDRRIERIHPERGHQGSIDFESQAAASRKPNLVRQNETSALQAERHHGQAASYRSGEGPEMKRAQPGLCRWLMRTAAIGRPEARLVVVRILGRAAL